MTVKVKTGGRNPLKIRASLGLVFHHVEGGTS